MAFSTLITISTTLGQLVESYWSGYSFKSNEYTEDGVPVLTKGDIKPRGLIEHGGKFVPWDLISSKSIRLTEADDFLVSTRDLTTAANFLGLVSRAPNTPHAVNQGVTVFKVKTNIVDKSYLAYWCESPVFRGHIKGHYAGATQIHIRHADLMAAPVMLPNMSEQRRIASILSAYDDLIENNTRRIAILEEMARRIYEEWFVHFRFPGHEQVKMVESELGLIPEGWRKGSISELYVGLYDGPHATPKPTTSGPVFLGIGNLTETGRMDFSSVRHIAEEDFGKWTKRVCPQAGDIVFTYEATLNRYALIPNGFRGCLGRRLALIRTNPEVHSNLYLFCKFFSDGWRQVVAQNTLSGATVDRIPLSKFPSFPIMIPSMSIMAAFDGIVRPMFAEIEILGRKNVNLRTTRDLLLPKLISGELDVSNLPAPEEAIAA